MTPADAAQTVRRIITDAYMADADYRAVVDRELREIAREPVPVDAKERTWDKIKASLIAEPVEATAAATHLHDAAITGSDGAFLLSSGRRGTPCRPVAHSGGTGIGGQA